MVPASDNESDDDNVPNEGRTPVMLNAAQHRIENLADRTPANFTSATENSTVITETPEYGYFSL